MSPGTREHPGYGWPGWLLALTPLRRLPPPQSEGSGTCARSCSPAAAIPATAAGEVPSVPPAGTGTSRCGGAPARAERPQTAAERSPCRDRPEAATPPATAAGAPRKRRQPLPAPGSPYLSPAALTCPRRRGAASGAELPARGGALRRGGAALVQAGPCISRAGPDRGRAGLCLCLVAAPRKTWLGYWI